MLPAAAVQDHANERWAYAQLHSEATSGAILFRMRQYPLDLLLSQFRHVVALASTISPWGQTVAPSNHDSAKILGACDPFQIGDVGVGAVEVKVIDFCVGERHRRWIKERHRDQSMDEKPNHPPSTGVLEEHGGIARMIEWGREAPIRVRTPNSSTRTHVVRGPSSDLFPSLLGGILRKHRELILSGALRTRATTSRPLHFTTVQSWA